MILRQPGAEATWGDDGKKTIVCGEKGFFWCLIMVRPAGGASKSQEICKYAQRRPQMVDYASACLRERQELK